MMISVGLWIVPTVATVLAFWTAWIKQPSVQKYGVATPLAKGFFYALAFVLSLVSWLVWALIT
jgi:hypothetical protein